MNETYVAKQTSGGGFGTHPHDNMEIISIVLDGALEPMDRSYFKARPLKKETASKLPGCKL